MNLTNGKTMNFSINPKMQHSLKYLKLEVRGLRSNLLLD